MGTHLRGLHRTKPFPALAAKSSPESNILFVRRRLSSRPPQVFIGHMEPKPPDCGRRNLTAIKCSAPYRPLLRCARYIRWSCSSRDDSVAEKPTCSSWHLLEERNSHIPLRQGGASRERLSP